ncbi:MAG: CD1871A family CXXC motif-containing protein [Bacillota bacterium]|jgi:hypothetical protein|nr:thioredoxin [Bacillota bacterium]
MRRNALLALIAVGVALMVLGGLRGDYWTILANARTICLSCIGIE